MKRFLSALCIVMTLTASASLPVLRFKQFKPRQHDGLVRMQTPAPMKPTAPLKVSTEGRPELVANCILSKPGYGIYSFHAAPDMTFERKAVTPAFEGGAVYVNGKYYACAYDYDTDHNLTMMKWYTYDALTWTLQSERDNPLDFSYIATDRTYDQSTGKVYSISYDKKGQAIWLSTTDVKTGAPSMIAPLQKDVITIAANKQGELYGIDTNANLYRINPTDAALTLIGNTAIFEDYLSDYTQSITFDNHTGKLYWAEFHTVGWFESASALYEVNTSTGKAVKIADIPGNPELTGLFVNRYASDGVPDEVTDITANPQNDDATSFTFSFTAPSRSVDGVVLAASEDLEVEISVDGNLIDLVNVKPGASATSEAHTFARGLHSLSISPSNSVGTGVMSGESFFAGYDVPEAPGNVTLSASGMTAKLKWDAPAKGAQGGRLRTPVTYNVARMPGNVTVASGIAATSFSETLDVPAQYHYAVTAVSPEGTGPAAESNSLAIAVFNTPWQCGFDTQGMFDLFAIANFSQSIKVWNYDESKKCARHSWDLSYATDDWLISPAINLDANYAYEISFDAWQMVESYPEHFELWYGTSPDPQNMIRLLDTDRLPVTAKTYSAMAAPLADGTHYFAIRGNNPKNGMMSYVDNLKISPKGNSNVPAGVGNFRLSAADGGVTAVTVDFDAPDKMMNNMPLTSISGIDIIRGAGNEPIKTFDNPAPGSHLSWTDNSVSTGTFTYSVAVRTPQGVSQPASGSVFAGIDKPEAPSDVKAERMEQGYKISWNAPAHGVNGGNLNGLLSYRVERVVNNDIQLVDAACHATDFLDSWMPEQQAMARYRITAMTEAGESEPSVSEGFEVGKPYQLPYAESFPGAVADTNPWVVQNVIGTSGSWQLCTSGDDPYVKAQDNDNGVATFDGYHSWAANMELRLISPRINISSYADPELSFHLYHYNGLAGWWQEEPDPVEEWLQVEISADGSDFEAIPNARFDVYAPKSEWKQYKLPLAQYNMSSEVRLAFRGHAAGCSNIHIDNIEVKGSTYKSGVSCAVAGCERVYTLDGRILFEGLSSRLQVYDLAGNCVASTLSTEGSISLTAGIYLARTSNQVYKLYVK